MFERPASLYANRLSVLTAAVLLALVLTGFIQVERPQAGVQFLGLYLPVGFNLRILTTLLAAALTATGMDWFLRSHPRLEAKSTFTHWLLPTLTTLVVSVPLYVLPSGGLWWLAFAVGGILLVLVFVAEYVAVDPSDALYPPATAGLIALSLAMFFILSLALRYAALRLIGLLPLLFLAASLVSLRALHLFLHRQWEYAWAVCIALACTQIAAGLHYWPLSPLQFGLLLIAPLYALINLAKNVKEGVPIRRAFVEPAIILGLLAGLLLVFR